MSQQTTIRKLAELVNTPVEKLLEQLAEAGMSFRGPDQVITSMEKVKLLGFLKRSHSKAQQAAEEPIAPSKITLSGTRGFVVGDESLPSAPRSDDGILALAMRVAQSLTKRLPTEQDTYWFVVEQYDRLISHGGKVGEILSGVPLFEIEHRGSRSETSYVGKPNPGVVFLDQKVMPPLEGEYGREVAQRIRATIYALFCDGFRAEITRLRIKYAIHYANNCSSAGHFNKADEWDSVISALEEGG